MSLQPSEPRPKLDWLPEGELWPGQRLSQAEFLARWGRSPFIKTAELIDGVVHMGPVTYQHGCVHSDVSLWLGGFLWHDLPARPFTNVTWLFGEHALQPDSSLIIKSEAGGRFKVRDDLLASAPELIVEVAIPSVEMELGRKRELYEQAGVDEYVIVIPREERIVWHVLREGRYTERSPDADGIYRSVMFPHLWLDGEALLADDAVRVKAVADAGMATRPGKARP